MKQKKEFENVFHDIEYIPGDLMSAHHRQKMPKGDVAPWQQCVSAEEEYEKSLEADSLLDQKRAAWVWLQNRIETLSVEDKAVLQVSMTKSGFLNDLAKQWGVTRQAVHDRKNKLIKRLRKERLKAGIRIEGWEL